jgi:hypothetical protein
MNEALVQLIQAIKDLSPQVWEIYLRQVYINGIEQTVAAILLLLSFFVMIWFLRGDSGNTDYKDRPISRWEHLDEMQVLVFFLVLLPLALAVVLTFCAFESFANPEFLAIQYLLKVIGG